MNRLNQKGQGTTEYVVIVGAVVLIALLIGSKLSPVISDAITSIAASIKGAGGGGGN